MERALEASLRRYGQMSPVVVFRWHDRYELIDGFKRLAAARALREVSSLCARVIEADERSAKAAIYSLNRVSGKPSELEEAWIVHALVRDDGLPQVDVAELLGRHKSWVCRRLALIERLEEAAQAELKLGLLSPTCARQLVRLPPGNQDALLAVIRREALTTHEVAGVVDLLQRAPSRELQQYILDTPREALLQAEGRCLPSRDPRLSGRGNEVWKRLGVLLELLARMERWLTHDGRAAVTPKDHAVLAPRFGRLAQVATSVAALARDFEAA
ncbi:MAG: ParB N-terminal domain-containing protein [Acidobacteria bacterium]|nr:ParB N-terminal domain-containing protein [Acidobacteriota bacterium]